MCHKYFFFNNCLFLIFFITINNITLIRCFKLILSRANTNGYYTILVYLPYSEITKPDYTGNAIFDVLSWVCESFVRTTI